MGGEPQKCIQCCRQGGVVHSSTGKYRFISVISWIVLFRGFFPAGGRGGTYFLFFLIFEGSEIGLVIRINVLTNQSKGLWSLKYTTQIWWPNIHHLSKPILQWPSFYQRNCFFISFLGSSELKTGWISVHQCIFKTSYFTSSPVASLLKFILVLG